MKFRDIFNNSENTESVGNMFRTRRFSFFLKKMNNIRKPVNILDVGGKISFWENRGITGNNDFKITILNLNIEKVTYSNIKYVVGDALNLSNYEDESFDVVHSNSVIEHLHSFDNQKKMASEVQRVGKKHIVQTPNKFFFIEPHYLLPFFQFLPKKYRYIILTKTNLSRLKKWDKKFAKQYLNEIRLLSLWEMKKIFPNSKIYFEKFLGMNKSFTAHNFH